MSYREIIDEAVKMGKGFLPEYEAYQICDEFDIPYSFTRFATDWEQLENEAAGLGYPVVLKIVSPAIVHKSDVGGVITGINSREELEKGYHQLIKNVREKAGDVPIQGVLAQRAMPKGVEVVVGGIRDEHFGPVIMFGLGGIMIEVFKNVAFRLAPLNQDEALRQIMDTKAYEVLKGVRGTKPCDINALARLIVNAGKLLAEIPEIQELDFNPILVYSDGCVAVDARMIINIPMKKAL